MTAAPQDDRRVVPIDEAIQRIGDGERIHTFRNPAGGVMLGADWGRAKLIDAMRRFGVEDSGPAACAAKHTLVIVDYGGSPLFIEAAPGGAP